MTERQATAETRERVPVGTLSKDEVEEIVRDMDWTAIHKARVLNDAGDRVALFTDGTFAVMDSAEQFRDADASGVIAELEVWGLGDIDESLYIPEGIAVPESRYVEYDEETDTYRLRGSGAEVAPDLYIVNGDVLDREDALVDAIEHGDWGGYEYEIEDVMRGFAQSC